MNTTFIDTHCHLNFKRFNKTREQVIINSQNRRVSTFIVPGTDILSSQKAIELTIQNKSLYAAVGIHPHHIYNYIDQKNSGNKQIEELILSDLMLLEDLIQNKKVVAVGEIGLDTYQYETTKYVEYVVSRDFLNLQKELLIKQIALALKYKKSIILHNRETKRDLLSLLDSVWNEDMRFRTVFHCCEEDEELLTYAIKHNIYIGIDGDVTYGGGKAEFAKKIPLEQLVLETDSPYILPEPLRTQKLYPNTPANIPLIAQCIADLKGVSLEDVARVTTENARKLFGI